MVSPHGKIPNPKRRLLERFRPGREGRVARALPATREGVGFVMSDSNVSYETVIEGGKHWSLNVSGGTLLRLTDTEGGANVGMLFYNPRNTLERYNAPDTLKCQHTFKLTKGHCLYSDMGRIFCSIVEDTNGWHDTVCGNSTKRLVATRWGDKNYQTSRNEWTQNGHDAFLVEAGKYGLGRRDLAANVNWFSKVSVADDGTLVFDPGSASAGALVALRFEMETLVLLHTCPHPLNTAPEYPRKPVKISLSKAPPVDADDFCKNSRPENVRGFANTDLYRLCGCRSEGASSS
jgi:urea carboxylase-associated protein 2